MVYLHVLIWPLIFAGFLAVVAWRLDRLADRWLAAKTKISTEEELTLRERRIAADIAEAVLPATIALKNARLAKEEAATKAAARLVDTMQTQRLAAEKCVLEARTKAEEKLAEELVRADRAMERFARQGGGIVALYGRYLAAMSGRDAYHIDAFLQSMSNIPK